MRISNLRSFISLLIIAFITSCSTENKTKIGFLYTSKVTDRYVKESTFFAERARQLGAEVTVMDADNNDALQYKRAIELFDSGIDVLCMISVNVNTAGAIVREGKKRGVKVVAYNRLIKGVDLDLFISGDNKTLGEQLCSEVLKHKPKGNYILLGGDKFDRNAVELQQSIDSILSPYIADGRISILYNSYIEDWSETNAAFELDQILAFSKEKPDVIIAAYDGIADGCIKVLEKYNMAGDVLITGQDAELRAVKHILKEEQLITVYHPLKQIAYTGAEACVNLAKDKKLGNQEISYVDNGFKKIPSIKIPSIPVTKETIDEVLIKSGFYTKEEIYQ